MMLKAPSYSDPADDFAKAHRYVEARRGREAAEIYAKHKAHVARSAELLTLFGRAEVLRGRKRAAIRLFFEAERLARVRGDEAVLAEAQRLREEASRTSSSFGGAAAVA